MGSGIDLDLQIMEGLFVKSQSSPKGKKRGNAPSKKKVALIDSKRARNIAISLARVKLSYKAIREGIEALDLNVGDGQLGILRDALPDQREMQAIARYRGDSQNLGEAERFFLVLRGLEDARDRIDCMQCKLSFENKLSEVARIIQISEQACSEVRNSECLHRVFEVVLEVGNRLNQLTGEPQLRAFSLDSLEKLSQTKSYDKKTTVLQFIAQYIDSKLPDVSKFYDDLPTMSEASKLPLSSAQVELNYVKKGLQLISKKLRDAPISDPAWSPYRNFVKRARKQVQVVIERAAAAKQAYLDMLKYLAQDTSKRDEDFYKLINSFVNSYKSASSAAMKAAAAERRRKIREENASKTSKGSKKKSKETKVPERNKFGRVLTPKEQLLSAIRRRSLESSSAHATKILEEKNEASEENASDDHQQLLESDGEHRTRSSREKPPRRAVSSASNPHKMLLAQIQSI